MVGSRAREPWVRRAGGRGATRAAVLLALGLPACLAPATVLAQATRAFERPPPLPEPALEPDTPRKPAPEASFTLPPLETAPEAVTPGPALPRVFVRRIELEGNTVFSDAELAAVTRDYEQRELDATDLEALRVALTRHYVERGYINSGALLPDQQVEDGVVRLRIVEGVLAGVEVRGNAALDADWLAARLAPPDDAPLSLPALQQRLQLLLEQPLVARVAAEVLPGERRGEAVLRATVEENLPWQLDLQLDNAVSPSLGSVQGTLTGAYRSLTGRADALVLDATFAEGLRTVALDYERPFNSRDTRLLASAQWSDADVVEQPFNEIDVESQSWTARLGLRQPLLDTPGDKVFVSASLERRHSETFLLGIPFSFSPGVRDGVSDVSALRLAQEWVHRAPDEVLALRSTFSIGLDLMGSTVNPGGLPDSRFLAWLGQAQWVRRLPWSAQLVLRLDGQWSADPLLPIEKYALGGFYSVRGYRQDLLVREQGFAGSLEYRHTLWRDEARGWRLEVAPFLDGGGAFDQAGATPEPELLWSAGLGLRGEAHRVQARLYWGHAFTEDRLDGDDIQDSGVHFQLAGQLF